MAKFCTSEYCQSTSNVQHSTLCSPSYLPHRFCKNLCLSLAMHAEGTCVFVWQSHEKISHKPSFVASGSTARASYRSSSITWLRSSTASTMEAADLARWTRFAAKGGIGKCTAISDCVAENPDDLMFLKVFPHSFLLFHASKPLQDDEITVLMQLTDPQGVYLVRVIPLNGL